MSNYDYYRLNLKLVSPMLGTGTEVSIYHEHVLQKAKKEIDKANRLAGKLTKSLEKYHGANISDQKELEELQGLLRAYCQILGKKIDLPESVEGVLDVAKSLQDELEESLKNGDSVKATVFSKDKDGMPIISTHMVLGNFKENLKIVVNSGNKDIIKSKVAVSEALALDIKSVEKFMRPGVDIMRTSKFKVEDLEPSGRGRWLADMTGRILLERPIKFERMGKVETAIAMSEVLPEGTQMECILRVRSGSALNKEALEFLLDMGKNNGLGSWRGSGNMGAYLYKLEELKDFTETHEDGWK